MEAPPKFQLDLGQIRPVYEFPVTIEDEAKPELMERLESANNVIGNIATTHGLVVILVPPDANSRKLDFEQNIVETWGRGPGSRHFASSAIGGGLAIRPISTSSAMEVGGRCPCMPEPIRHGRDVDPGRQQFGGDEVPEVVNAQLWPNA